MNETNDTVKSARTCDQACRQSSRGFLEDLIKRHHQKAKELQVIADMLPANPTPQQDAALWSFLINAPRP